MRATMRNTTPAAKLNSRKATVSKAIHSASARLPKIVYVFGNSMLILPTPNKD
jgi:hypothetical protein